MPLSTTVPPLGRTPFAYLALHKHIILKEPIYMPARMSSSLTLEQVAKQALREKAEMEAQVKYPQTQLDHLLEEKRRRNRTPNSYHTRVDSDESDREENSVQGNSSERGSIRRPHGRREGNFGDFKVDIPKFEG